MLNRRRGFTLIEMAIVLVIVGLILATTMPLLTERMARDKATKGARGVNTLKQEIIGYAMMQGHLPTADYVADNFSGAEDTWGNPVAYYPAAGLPGEPGDGNTISGAGTPTNLDLIRTTAATPPSTTYPDMAFILVSLGPNHHAEAGWNGASSGDGDAGYAGDFEYFDRGGYGLQDGYHYDDIVEYVTLGYLQTKVDDNQSGTGPANCASSFNEDGIANVLSAEQSGRNSSSQGSNNPVVINSDTNELELGGVDEATGCTWYMAENGTVPCNDTVSGVSGVVACSPGSTNSTSWKSLHFVMRFNFVNKDYYGRPYNQRYAGGWTFAIISAVTSYNIQTLAPCGTGSGEGAGYLGYASYPTGSYDFVDDPKFGVEVDIFKDLGQTGTVDRQDADPGVTTPYTDWGWYGELNHVANVYWEFDRSLAANNGAHGDDNLHGHTSTFPAGRSNANPAYNASSNATGMIAGRAADSGLMWLEDGEDHWMRVELHRDTASTSTGAGNVTYTTYTWLDDTPNATFLDMGASMVGTAAANYEYTTNSTITFDLNDTWGGSGNINTMMNKFRFGWTTSTGSESGRNGQNPNTVNIGQFGWSFTTF